MKTDAEVRAWIDSKDVLTKSELCYFMYDKKTRCTTRTRVERHWHYALQTKGWKKLKDHKIQKLGLNKFRDFKKIIKSDKRFKDFGVVRSRRLLKDVYGFTLSKSTFSKYQNIICNSQNSH